MHFQQGLQLLHHADAVPALGVDAVNVRRDVLCAGQRGQQALRSAVDGGAKGRDAFFLQQFDSGEPFGGDRDFDHNARHGIAQTFGLFHHALRVAAHGLREEGALRTDGFLQARQHIPDRDFTGGDNARVGGYPGQRVDAGQAFHFGDVGGIQIEFHSVFLNA